MRRTNAMLWTIQGVLALTFLMVGGMKLLTPATTLAPMTAPISVGLVKFIGLCEVTGAFGLILPGLLRIRTTLTPLAAAGLVIIMSGATSACLAMGRAGEAAGPAVLGVLAILIVYGRFFRAPIAQR